ncbi:MAG: NADH-quinone oxidoreductase subunit A [Oscillospiraceae bacterium]|nr:NADH-quinone oxidoreductase subunit A [Oscillospiraceae bacterium]
MNNAAIILLAPPVVFVIYLFVCTGISFVFKRLAAKGEQSPNKESAYACGEHMEENKGQPDYTEFFKVAFSFTIMHVIALVVATDPVRFSVTSAVYLGVTVLALFMLLRK